MKPTRLAHVSFLAMTLAAAGLGEGAARADIITLDLSGTMTPPFSGRGDCSPTCTLGGNIVIDNSVGAPNSGLVSADVTATGFLPNVGPWTRFFGVGVNAGLTELVSDDASDNALDLIFATPTAGSLVGYTGGPLDTRTNVSTLGLPPSLWTLTSGSLTRAAAAPEPSSLLLLVSALAGLAGVFFCAGGNRSDALGRHYPKGGWIGHCGNSLTARMALHPTLHPVSGKPTGMRSKVQPKNSVPGASARRSDDHCRP